MTSRYYGQSEELLGKYGWYQKNSADRSWPVASLKPNDFGLFDMHGNAFTWCQNRYSFYTLGQGGKAVEDGEDATIVMENTTRVLRGGSFTVHPRLLRSALRLGTQPGDRTYYFGFRPARTYN